MNRQALESKANLFVALHDGEVMSLVIDCTKKCKYIGQDRCEIEKVSPSFTKNVQYKNGHIYVCVQWLDDE